MFNYKNKVGLYEKKKHTTHIYFVTLSKGGTLTTCQRNKRRRSNNQNALRAEKLKIINL